jgi:thiamine-phosphate pyrophosphorylase
MTHRLPRGLYAITPDWNDTLRLIAATEAILRGGGGIIQYRNKTTSACHRLEQAGALRQLTARHAALLIVNDDVELALAVAADGVHIGADDGDIGATRRRLGADRLLGVSCYQNAGLAQTASHEGADYVAFGSFFPSPTKPQAKRAGIELLDKNRHGIALPVVAIGGITPDNAGELVRAGADLLAVISALYEADRRAGQRDNL